MTAVAGFTHTDGSIWIGADSCGGSNLAMTARRDEKVFHKGPFLFGFTTSFRMGQLIRYKFNPPEHVSGKTTLEYLVTDFTDSLRDCFKSGGFANKKEDVETAGTFLLGYRNALYRIDTDYQIAQSLRGYDAVGCAEQFCIGSLATTATMSGMSPHQRLTLALTVAEKHSCYVQQPFVIETQPFLTCGGMAA